MKASRRKLRKMILEEVQRLERLQERRVASVSDITRASPIIEQWASSLIDDLAKHLPNGQMLLDLDQERRKNMEEGIRSAVTGYLITRLGSGLSPYASRRIDRENTAKTIRQHRLGLGI